MTDTEKNMDEISANDKQLIEQLQKMLDGIADIRRVLISREYGYKRNGCVCEGPALCAHHADVYDRLDQASDSLALAIRAAGRVE